MALPPPRCRRYRITLVPDLQSYLCAAPTPPIAPSWLQRPAVTVSPELLGCVLVRQYPTGETVRGVIAEVEAYEPGDPACHAYRRRTARNEAMFRAGGAVYVYLIYGIYHCLNIVTDHADVPSAILIRAIALDHQPASLQLSKPQKLARIAAGPGKLCRALTIDRTLNNTDLGPNQPLWLEQRSPQFQQDLDQGIVQIYQTTRIGLSQGQDLPWRWYIKDCAAVSKL